MCLSNVEELILLTYSNDDFVWKFHTDKSPGWKNPMSHTWIKGFHIDCDISEELFLSILYGLMLKQIIGVDDNIFWLTDYGKQVWEKTIKSKSFSV